MFWRATWILSIFFMWLISNCFLVPSTFYDDHWDFNEVWGLNTWQIKTKLLEIISMKKWKLPCSKLILWHKLQLQKMFKYRPLSIICYLGKKKSWLATWRSNQPKNRSLKWSVTLFTPLSSTCKYYVRKWWTAWRNFF